jgi:large subunit ribosomal protein L5
LTNFSDRLPFTESVTKWVRGVGQGKDFRKLASFSNISENRKDYMVQRLQQFYDQKIVPQLLEQFQYTNTHQVPVLEKIVINRGLGDASQNTKLFDSYSNELSMITGQHGITTRSKKAIAGFKLRQKMPVGIVVTLRADRMYAFLDRLVNLALPRIRDFQGLNPKSFDGHGNYSLGLDEQLMFPEIDYDKIDQIRGMDISIITSARSDEQAMALLKAFGMPFKA